MLRRTTPRVFGCWWFGVRRRRAGGLEYVAVEKDDGSNFAFAYGDMAMLQYCRSQHFDRHPKLGTNASWEQRSPLTSMMSCRSERWRREANTNQAAHVAREDIIDASLAALRKQLEIRSSRTRHRGWVFFVQSMD